MTDRATPSAIEGSTPRTDAFLAPHGHLDANKALPRDMLEKWIRFTRQLERELAYAVSKNHEEIAADRAAERAFSSSVTDHEDLARRLDNWGTNFPIHATMNLIREAACALRSTRPSNAASEDAALTYKAFWDKHAKGSLACPSCLLCGNQHPRAEWAIKHAELPDIYICQQCVSSALPTIEGSTGFAFHPPFVMCEEKGDHWIEDSKGNPVDRASILHLLNMRSTVAPRVDGWMVACSEGKVKIMPGDQWVDDLTQSRWRVEEPAGNFIYSPSGLGGTPCFWCSPVGDVPAMWKGHQDNRGWIEFCGDSIAGSIARANPSATGKRDA